MRFTLTVLTCGRCGKPRGRHHLCRGSRKGRDRLRVGLRFTCGTCGREMANPLRHTCSMRSDFARRRKAAERAERTRRRRERRKQQRAEAARRRKAAERERRAKASAERKARKPRASPHNPRHCADPECQRYPCRLYRDGFTDGVASVSEGDETG